MVTNNSPAASCQSGPYCFKMPFVSRKRGLAIISGAVKRGRYGKFRRSLRRRRTYKRRGNVRNKSTVSQGLGFPKKQLMTHKWSTTTVPAAITGTLGYIRIAANDVYKPDYNAGGTVHSAYYFNQMNALYDHHTVIGSKIFVEVMNVEDNSTAGPFEVGIFIDDDNSFGFTSMTGAAEQSNGYAKIVPGGNDITTKLSKKWSAKKTFGAGVMANDKLTGSGLAGPAEHQFYTICWQNVFSSDPGSIVMKISVEYITVWTELKDIQISTNPG